MVLDLAAGGDLFEKIITNDEPPGRFEEDTAKVYMLQLMRGLEACHNHGIAHRDLKPENLLLTEDDRLVISDFGLSNWFSSEETGGEEVLLKTPCGTPKYAAPELIQGLGLYDATKIDVWSSGVILYIMCGGAFPWVRASPDDKIYSSYVQQDGLAFQWPQHFSPEIIELFQRMCHVEPAARCTVAEVIQSAWMAPVVAMIEGAPAAMEVEPAPLMEMPAMGLLQGNATMAEVPVCVRIHG